MNKNRLSIIIPVYNAEEYLDRCLQSVVNQGFTSYEVILVDDGSKDSSPLICDRYSATDPRFRTIHRPNAGVGASRNAGINLAKGEYLLFLDSDDALLPDALERMMEVVVNEDIVIGGYTAYINGIPGKEILPQSCRTYKNADMARFFEDNIRKTTDILDMPWAKLFRRKAVGSLRFREDLCYAEDKLFVFSFLAKCSSAYTCDIPVYAQFVRPDSLGSDTSSDRHLMQLRCFIPAYIDVLDSLTERYPLSRTLGDFYRNEIVSKYLCRIMDIFKSRRTAILTEDYLRWVYDLLDRDGEVGIFSIRAGQVLNLALYKIDNLKFTKAVYKFTSLIFRGK